MKLSTLREDSIKVGKSNQKIDLGLTQDYQIKYYPKSYNEKNGISFIIGTIGNEKSLFLISGIPDNELIKEFEGNKVENSLIEDAKVIKKCPLNQKNSEMLQKHFEFTRPKVIGLVNSFGFGDRLGLANAGHIRALEGYDFVPIFAQQSVRELTRTHRKPR